MLRKLLDLIRSEGISSQTELARQMGISIETLSALIQQLVRMGYLEGSNPACDSGSACAHCDVKSGCAPAMKMWTLTEKGKSGAG